MSREFCRERPDRRDARLPAGRRGRASPPVVADRIRPAGYGADRLPDPCLDRSRGSGNRREPDLGFGRRSVRPLRAGALRRARARIPTRLLLESARGDQSRRHVVERAVPLVDGAARRLGLAGPVDRVRQLPEPDRHARRIFSPGRALSAQGVRCGARYRAGAALHQRARPLRMLSERLPRRRGRAGADGYRLYENRLLQCV